LCLPKTPSDSFKGCIRPCNNVTQPSPYLADSKVGQTFDERHQSDRIVYQVASLVCVLIATDNLLRWLERGGNSNWFWLCAGSVAIVVLFGILALVAQFFYWAKIVKGLNDQLVEGSGHRHID